jgi:NAD(P)H-dependent flavin oxidoreductase YrpB (nitropropane dioxygenase family)
LSVHLIAFPHFDSVRGDIESMGLLAGQGVGLVQEIKPAGEVVREIMAQADRIMEGLQQGFSC